MRYWSYIGYLMLGAILAACSAEETNDNKSVPVIGDAISYTVTAAQTRTVFTGTVFPTDETFRIWAYEAGNIDPLINGDVVSYNTGKSAWTTTATYEWPSGNVDFYALYPASMTLNTADKTINYTVPTAVSSQADILYDVITAAKGDVAVTKNPVVKNAVPITFHHALAQIAFKGKVKADNKEWTVNVNGIEICNVASTGTFSLTTKAWSTLTTPATFALGMSTSLGAISFYEVDGTTEAQATNLTADDGAMLLIPQALSAWDRSTNVSATTGCYLIVTFHVCNNGTDLYGTADSPVKVYVPFDNTNTIWEPGKRYVYTLQFGSGYDADGKQQLQPLIISSEITDWADGSNEIINANN